MIFGPIDHVGWASASSTGDAGQLGPPCGPGTGPPLAVSTIRGSSRPGADRRPAGTGGWRSARSRPGSARPPAWPAAAARPVRRRSGSPCWPAPAACPPRSVARVTGSPAKPTTPLTTTSASSARSARSSTTSANGRASATSARRAGSATATTFGRSSRAWAISVVDRGADAEADDLVAVALGADDVEGLGADRARRAGDGDPHRHACSLPGWASRCRPRSAGRASLRRRPARPAGPVAT